jgi:predicted small lipoprotein YifL
MNRRLQTVFVAALAIALPLLLSACGNKGPLVMPDRPAETPAAAPAPQAAPATPTPAADRAATH